MRIALLANPDNLHSRRWIEFLRRRGHELLVIADPHTQTRPENVRIAVPRWNLATNILAFKLTPQPHGNSIWKYLHYRPILREFAPEIVHGFEAYYNGLATAWAGDYPKVLTPWGKDVQHDAFQGPLWRWIVRRSLEGVDVITTNDETMPEFLEMKFGVPRAKTNPFSWGVDLAIFNPGHASAAGEWRRKLDIPSDSPVVFSPRKFHPYWGAERVIAAIPEILTAHPAAVFVLLAPEDEHGFRAAMKRRLEAEGISRSVRWIEEWLAPEQMAELFNLSDLFISVPQTDLLAMTVLEGMACGSMPALSNLNSYRKHAAPEMGDGRNAVVLEKNTPGALSRAVCTILADPARRREAAKFNIARMTELENAEINMAKIETVYRAAIEAWKRKRRSS
ncbi:glycosyltransferase family 4 protein [Candidatus Sumerlaeota bacterium]|nr:glycosyltransferase family 4 protein [Candidatus Sumerlaeota bacterium]